MRLISQGAEAKIFLTNGKILKRRFDKGYRIKEIDKVIKKRRTKKEANLLKKLKLFSFPSPKLIDTDNYENISMGLIKGDKVRDILSRKNYKGLCADIGKKIAILHNNAIIHGDLTTSNMLFNKEVFFIDYGLSFYSHKIEDMAVDLHLLKRAYESKHYKISKECFLMSMDSYLKYGKKGNEVKERLKKVEKRGRYK